MNSVCILYTKLYSQEAYRLLTQLVNYITLINSGSYDFIKSFKVDYTVDGEVYIKILDKNWFTSDLLEDNCNQNVKFKNYLIKEIKRSVFDAYLIDLKNIDVFTKETETFELYTDYIGVKNLRYRVKTKEVMFILDWFKNKKQKWLNKHYGTEFLNMFIGKKRLSVETPIAEILVSEYFKTVQDYESILAENTKKHIKEKIRELNKITLEYKRKINEHLEIANNLEKELSKKRSEKNEELIELHIQENDELENKYKSKKNEIKHQLELLYNNKEIVEAMLKI